MIIDPLAMPTSLADEAAEVPVLVPQPGRRRRGQAEMTLVANIPVLEYLQTEASRRKWTVGRLLKDMVRERIRSGDRGNPSRKKRGGGKRGRAGRAA